ncbi:hypothetical protein Kpn21f22_44570 [Klebsiella pneumoniae]|nr:hypothetical protein Kpn21f22_44570 [Klebsiella pneumoniae]
MFFRETLRGIPLPTRQAQRRRAMTTGTALLLCRAAAHALPGIRFVRPAVNLFTIVAETAGVAASKSLRRSRKAGAARMDAG